jgi:hypothetical protein
MAERDWEDYRLWPPVLPLQSRYCGEQVRRPQLLPAIGFRHVVAEKQQNLTPATAGLRPALRGSIKMQLWGSVRSQAA